MKMKTTLALLLIMELYGLSSSLRQHLKTEFVLVHQNETWEGALEYCRTHYTDLASLSTKERMDSALLEITQAETEYVWTGLRFLAGDWFWVTGDDLNYTAWYQNEQPQGHMMRFQFFLSLCSVTRSLIKKICKVAKTKVSNPKRYSL
uniref:C-type lectin domain-containing protein n=1 Tax=Cyprinus carpio TaxID=7962 RepID=A0A8C1Q630_CYPCA